MSVVSGGSKGVTITDIAKKAGVSTATVSRVLNNTDYPVSPELRKRITKLAEEMNYVPNLFGKMLKGVASRDIGILLPTLVNPFYAHVVMGIEHKCREYDMNPLFCSGGNSIAMEQKYLDRLLQSRVVGLLISPITSDAPLIKRLIEKNENVVLFDQCVGDLPCDSVCYDFFAAGQMAVNHLIENGHRKIAFFTLPPTRSSRVAVLEGIQYQMHKWGLPFKDSDVFVLDDNGSSQHMPYFLPDELMKQLLNQESDVTAIIAVNDLLAMRVMKELKRANRKIPDDISIIGLDNINICDLVDPPLTTINQPAFETGELAVKTLMDRLSRTLPAGIYSNIALRPTLVERNSVKKI